MTSVEEAIQSLVINAKHAEVAPSPVFAVNDRLSRIYALGNFGLPGRVLIVGPRYLLEAAIQFAATDAKR